MFLGIVLVNYKIEEVYSVLEFSDFYYLFNGLFFEIVLKLYEEDCFIDENFIC